MFLRVICERGTFLPVSVKGGRDLVVKFYPRGLGEGIMQ